MWIKTRTGMLNLAQAHEVKYEQAKETLTVWWAFALPHSAEYPSTGFAEIYDSTRLGYYEVLPDAWNAFVMRTAPNG